MILIWKKITQEKNTLENFQYVEKLSNCYRLIKRDMGTIN